MFVSKSKYEKVCMDLDVHKTMNLILAARNEKYVEIINDYSKRLSVYESKGKKSNISKAEIEDLIRLCHPDKHENSERSERILKRLLELRDK